MKQLYVFQREPGWVLPKNDRDFSEAELRALSNPFKRHWRKLKLMVKNEWAYLYQPVYQVNTKRNLAGRDRALAYLDKVFADRPDLKAALTPQYPFSGKRRILTDVFYPALKRENVELVPHEVAAITATGIVDSTGYEREVDVIVTAIGYKASDYLSSLRVFGRGGRDLHEKWRDGAFAFLGTAVPEFPNLYLLYGPNTNGAAPITYVHHRQAAYVVTNLKRMLGPARGPSRSSPRGRTGTTRCCSGASPRQRGRRATTTSRLRMVGSSRSGGTGWWCSRCC